MKKLVLFDFDGVIVDSFATGLTLTRHSLQDENFSPESLRDLFMGNIFTRIAQQKKTSVLTEADYLMYYGEMMPAPLPAVKDVLQKIDIPCGIVSSARSSSLHRYLIKYCLHEYFTSVLGADVHTSKVEKFKMAMTAAAVSAEETIFITDTLGDIREANHVGIDTIAVDR